MYNTRCADELFLQTVVMNSPFAEDVIGYNKRFVKFENGKACTLTDSDFNRVISSDALFARKFNVEEQSTIVESIRVNVKNR